MKERNQIIIKFVASHLLLLPVLLSLSLIFKEIGFLILPITQTVLFILFFAGYWEFLGIRLKWIYCLSIEVIIISWVGLKYNSGIAQSSEVFWLFIYALLQLYLFYVLAKIFIVIFKNEKEKVEIGFPFKHGIYLITDGGNSRTSRLMNYHFHSFIHKKKKTNHSMLFATDIVKINIEGSQFMPSKNDDYPIFSEMMLSPMEGVIFKVISNIDDNLPFSGDYPYNTGNTVVIKKDSYYFLIGHLKKGSIIVKEGDRINRNELIGEAGNSGMSERPHLHMQLMKSNTDDYWKGTGICIQYKNKNLYKNRLLKILK